MPSIENNIPASSLALPISTPGKWSLDMLIPIEAEMGEVSSMEALFSHYLEVAEEQLKKLAGESVSGGFLPRIAKIRDKLLSRISGRSMYLGLTDTDEKIIPLNFKTKAAVTLNQGSNILNLIGYAEIEPRFFIISRDETGESVFEYLNKKLLRIYFNEIPGPPNQDHGRFLNAVMSRSDSKKELPVFLTGNRGGQLTGLCRDRVLIEHVTGFSPYNVEYRAGAIADNWNYWHKKAIEGCITIAEKTGFVHSGPEEVLPALGKEKNGILIIDPAIIPTLDTTNNEISDNDPIALIESFLKRGNRVEPMMHSMISRKGGMVLLESPAAEYSNEEEPLNNQLHHREPILW